jgi:hypothetical protein
MKKLLVVAFLALAVWKGYGEYHSRSQPQPEASEGTAIGQVASASVVENQFRCDGRVYCRR